MSAGGGRELCQQGEGAVLAGGVELCQQKEAVSAEGGCVSRELCQQEEDKSHIVCGSSVYTVYGWLLDQDMLGSECLAELGRAQCTYRPTTRRMCIA